MKIKKPTTGQLAAIGAVAGILGLTLGGVALADGMARPDTPDGPRPYYDVVAEGTRQTVPPPPAPPRAPPPFETANDGPRPPRQDFKPRGPEHAAHEGRWNDERRGPPPHARGERKHERDARRAARGGEWVWCEYERDGDLDCDEDDRRTWASAPSPSNPR